jgi:hypothetical protein
VRRGVVAGYERKKVGGFLARLFGGLTRRLTECEKDDFSNRVSKTVWFHLRLISERLKDEMQIRYFPGGVSRLEQPVRKELDFPLPVYPTKG